MPSLNKFLRVRSIAVRAKWLYLTRVWKMDIHPTATFSLSAHFDKTYPQGIHIGEESYVALGAMILAHDTTRRIYRHTRVGRRCFIGARSLLLPGITVGDGSIVAAGAVVTRDVPPRSVVAGNPAAVIRSDISVGPYGRFAREEDRAIAAAAE